MLTTLLLASVTKSQCPLTTTPLGPDRPLSAAPVAGLKATPANGVDAPVIALTNVLVLALKTSTLRLERSATYKSWVSASSQLISQPWRGLRLVGTAMVPRSVIAPPFRPGSPAIAAPADSAPAHSTPASTHGSVDRGSNLVAACIVIALSPLEQAAFSRPPHSSSSRPPFLEIGSHDAPTDADTLSSSEPESGRAAPLHADEADARLRERLSQAEAVGGARVFHDQSGRVESGLSSGQETEAMTTGADTVT